VTIDKGARAAAMTRALKRLADLCGDARGITFGRADLIDAAPLGTTLAELEDAGYITLIAFLSDPNPYRLTIRGWVEAQRVSGRLESDEFDERRGRLCAALKRAVKGRDHEAILDYAELAQAAGLPEGWVWNILEGRVLHRLDPLGRYDVRFENGHVFVPPTFGQEPVL
jgi:hypothetical protein